MYREPYVLLLDTNLRPSGSLEVTDYI